MKLLGCCFIFLTFTFMGLHASSQLEKRIRQLKGLEKAILSIEREIDYRLSPIGDALIQTAKRTEFPWNLFFQNAGEAFSKNREKGCCPNQIFEDEIPKIRIYHPWEKDLKLLLTLGKGMGELDKKMQLSQLAMAKEEIQSAIKSAQEEQHAKGKLYQTLGICMGFLGVILVI